MVVSIFARLAQYAGNHNWVYCWRQLDFTSWNISKGILQFFAFSPGLNYLWTDYWFDIQDSGCFYPSSIRCFSTVFHFLMWQTSFSWLRAPEIAPQSENQMYVFGNISALSCLRREKKKKGLYMPLFWVNPERMVNDEIHILTALNVSLLPCRNVWLDVPVCPVASGSVRPATLC